MKFDCGREVTLPQSSEKLAERLEYFGWKFHVSLQSDNRSNGLWVSIECKSRAGILTKQLRFIVPDNFDHWAPYEDPKVLNAIENLAQYIVPDAHIDWIHQGRPDMREQPTITEEL